MKREREGEGQLPEVAPTTEVAGTAASSGAEASKGKASET